MTLARHYPCAVPLWGDVVALATTLMDATPQARADAAQDIISRAINNKAEGRYPDSIMGVCYMTRMPSEPPLTDQNYLDSLTVAITAVRDLNDLAAARMRMVAA